MEMKPSKFGVMMRKLGDISATWTAMLIASALYLAIVAILGWLAGPMLLDVVGAIGAAWRGQ